MLEFVGFGLLLQVPLLVTVLTLAGLQHDQLVVEAVSRDSLRSYLLIGASPEVTAEHLAETYGVPVERLKVEMLCEDDDCETEGNFIKVISQLGSVQSEVVGLR